MAKKNNFTIKLISVSTILSQAINDAADCVTVYFDRGYDGAGSDPIVDDDITAQGVTAAQVTSVITAFQQLANYADNAAVKQGDYNSSLNAVREDL